MNSSSCRCLLSLGSYTRIGAKGEGTPACPAARVVFLDSLFYQRESGVPGGKDALFTRQPGLPLLTECEGELLPQPRLLMTLLTVRITAARPSHNGSLVKRKINFHHTDIYPDCCSFFPLPCNFELTQNQIWHLAGKRTQWTIGALILCFIAYKIQHIHKVCMLPPRGKRIISKLM
jgi:hypothetical protein